MTLGQRGKFTLFHNACFDQDPVYSIPTIVMVRTFKPTLSMTWDVYQDQALCFPLKLSPIETCT